MSISTRELNFYKQAARRAGYNEEGPIAYNKYNMQNGHITEVAVCHLLGIYQRYLKGMYHFNIVLTADLDNYGCDVLLQTPFGNKFIQLKHSSSYGSRDFIPGTYVVHTQYKGSTVLFKLLEFYKIPIPTVNFEIEFLKIELDYVWKKYVGGLYK